ncbi:UDP-N-acetylmuramoyl-tripeptide--D-alanyl-D-alanine ligase [Paenibacillus eucommiae]|uniref:UDP-N-acetylmuramoyl-tripeptide--D-alanyl-D-alanine ligase n=1 Tax=Paenibacillus eucommiae TaxID=1355755 RepID=A0ABS4INP0_9BACL|nr:UDP-N-acetylmuramoyl-tripeptide--D-alanyl-D-alanine ligase [Paenibacillus eucommiae]MBP1989177.1 UDP-N-acetylmuramoyl-tripeptide--D-alanyl-D-alanine ligase [Paenibacillus eucommiae]
MNRPIIAITGSAGKTTTKEMLASILQRRWKTFKSFQNGNDVWFTTQYTKQINASHRAVVLEYGMKHAGDIRRHCQLIRPDIGIVTNVGKAHMGHFNRGITGIAAAKSELIQHMNANGMLFINKDDVHSNLLSYGRFKGQVVTIGAKHKANYQAQNIRYTNQGMNFEVRLRGKLHSFFIKAFGTCNVYNALFAVAAAHRLGCPVQQIRSGLLNYEQPYARLTVHRLRNGSILINDSFNTKPELDAALDVLTHVGGKGRKVAVLGMIQDMGVYRKHMHREVGKQLADKRIDYLYTFGSHAKQIGLGAIAAGFSSQKVSSEKNMSRLRKKLMGELRPGTTLLFKGSTGGNKVLLIHVVEAIVRAKG